MILLPAVLLFLLQGTQFWLKQTAGHRLQKQQSHTIALKTSAVRWEKYGKELRIGDAFFDVQHIKRNGDTLLLTGHYDDAETGLWEAMERMMHHAGTPSLSNLLLLLQCLLPLGIFRIMFLFFPGCRHWNSLMHRHISAAELFPPFLPPRLCSLFY